MAETLTTLAKLLIVRDIQEDATGAALDFQEGGRARLALSDANYATQMRLARRSLERQHPVGVRFGEGQNVAELLRADNDVPTQLLEEGPDRGRVFFQGHDGVYRLQPDHPESGRIHALLDEAIRRKGRVWFIAHKPDLALLDVMPAGWTAASDTGGGSVWAANEQQVNDADPNLQENDVRMRHEAKGAELYAGLGEAPTGSIGGNDDKTSAEQRQASAEVAEALKALETFVVENDDLLALESLIGRFNIFDALDIARVEIRHSKFLGFILDPAESHGQGQLFLKAVLMDLLKEAPKKLRPFSPIELDGTDLHGVTVRTEAIRTVGERIDLLITCQEPPFVVAVENKIGSQEHSNQLPRYKAKVQQQYPQLRPLFIYLTPRADEPSDDAWVPYSYTALHNVLTRVVTTHRQAIGEDVLVFLDHYLNLIGPRMNDPKIDAYCERIYKNHRRALELIFERVGSPTSGVMAEAEAALREDPRWHVFYRTNTNIDFVPKTWLQWLPAVGLDRRDDPRSWFVLRLELYVEDGKLDFYVEVRRMSDLAKRKTIVDKLIEKGPQFGFKHSGHKIKDNYTRVSGRARVLKWNENEVPDSDSIRAAVKRKLDEVFPRLESIPSVLKPLLNTPESAK